MNDSNIVGKTINEWTVISKDEIKSLEKKRSYYICKCSCGTIKSISLKSLLNNTSKSCGCLSGRKNFHFEKHNKIFDDAPKLKAYVDEEKNKIETIQEYTSGSCHKIYWKCEHGHSFLKAINLMRNGFKCPICTNHKLLYGYNDLETWCRKNNNEVLLEEWSDQNTRKPQEVGYYEAIRAYWTCSVCGHEWDTKLYSRVRQNSGCPKCAKRYSTSFPEQVIFYYSKLYFPDSENGNRTILNGKELDIYIPSKNIAIEYDGANWHKDSDIDENKNLLCKEKGITLYRIRENVKNNYKTKTATCFYYDYQDWKVLKEIILKIFNNIIQDDYDINIERDKTKIKEMYYSKVISNSLEEKYPQIAAEWHTTLNGKIKPNMVAAETHDSFYWLCDKGHTYEAMVKNRVRMCSNCPYCSGQKVLAGFNDIATTHPEIAMNYNNDKNNRKSTEISAGSREKVWWKCCKCGYEFQYELNTYINANYACPSCSNRSKTKFKKVLKYETGELFDTTVEAAKSLNVDKNDIKNTYKGIVRACTNNGSMAYNYHWFYVLVDFNGNLIGNMPQIKDNKEKTKSHIGEVHKMGYGQKAEIISVDAPCRVTIQFDDGTIVDNCLYSKVQNGKIKNPNYVKKTLKKEPELHSKKLKSILGKSKQMKDGSFATVVEDCGYNDITIQFDDGYICKNCTRRAFNNGSVINKKKRELNKYINMRAKMKCGKYCTIVEIDEKNILVKFDNDEKMVLSTLKKFLSGDVLTDDLSHNFKYRDIGTRRKMKCGEYATLIADRGAHDVDVQFDDGVIIMHRDRFAFETGTIQHPKTKTNYVGRTKQMKCGLMATVIEDNGWNDITIQFEDGVVVYHKRRSHFDIGNIKHNQ